MGFPYLVVVRTPDVEAHFPAQDWADALGLVKRYGENLMGVGYLPLEAPDPGVMRELEAKGLVVFVRVWVRNGRMAHVAILI